MKKLLAILGITFLSISSTFACSCMVSGHPLEAADDSSVVFIGDVSKITETTKNMDTFNIITNVIDFNIIYNIKGADTQTIQINTPKDSATCGFNFEEGKRYIVYAYTNEDDNTLSVSLCSRTSLLENATEDIQAFNIGIGENGEVLGNISTLSGTGEDIVDNIEDIIKNAEDNANDIIDINQVSSKKNIYIGIAIAILAIALIIIGSKTMRN